MHIFVFCFLSPTRAHIYHLLCELLPFYTLPLPSSSPLSLSFCFIFILLLPSPLTLLPCLSYLTLPCLLLRSPLLSFSSFSSLFSISLLCFFSLFLFTLSLPSSLILFSLQHRYIYSNYGRDLVSASPPQGILKVDVLAGTESSWIGAADEYLGEPIFAKKKDARKYRMLD